MIKANLSRIGAVLPHELVATFKTDLIVAISLIGLVRYCGLTSLQVLLLSGVLTAFYFAVEFAARRKKAGESSAWPALTFALLAIVFFAHKLAQLEPSDGALHFLNILGLSYLFLKLTSFAILSYVGQIREPSLRHFLAYCLYFPVFVSGPVLDYPEFSREIAKTVPPAEHAAMALEGVKRVILGLFKTVVVSRVTSRYTLYSLGYRALERQPAWIVVVSVYMLLVDLYVNFSGFTDIAIGISSCLGITVPENFNLPFLARNFQELWQRWHMSFSSWLKKYLFLPISKELMRFSFLKTRPWLVSPLALFFTFFCMGLWHGISLNFVVYGIFQGVGICVAALWANFARKQSWFPRYRASRVVGVSSWFLTMSYFSASLVFFSASSAGNLETLAWLLGHFSWKG